MKTQNFEKKANLPVKKNFGSFFLVLSDITNVREQFIKLEEVFPQILWKFWDLFYNT